MSQALLPPGGRLTAAGYLAELAREDLRQDEAERKKLAAELLAKYWPVARAVAARAFRELRGAVPLAELDSAAFNEIATAAQRFDPSLGFSPAPYFRKWATWGVKALLRQRGDDARLVRPDQEESGGWERHGGADEADAAERAELRRALQAFLQQQGPRERRAVALLGQGLDDDEVSERTGLSLAELELLRDALAAATGRERDRDLAPEAAAAAVGVPVKTLRKALQTGALQGRRRDGEWVIREAEAQAWARRRTSR